MQDSPIYSIFMFIAAIYVFRLWLSDMRTSPKPPKAFAGTEPSSLKNLLFASLGAIILVIAYTISENELGISSEQSSVKVFAIFAWLSASFFEELIFRGYLSVQNKGRGVLIFSCLAFSLVFAMFHPFLWDYSSENGFEVKLNLAGYFSTFCIFLNSIYFYFLRFSPLNKNKSLLPCILAHATYNVAVFAIKATQGFVQC